MLLLLTIFVSTAMSIVFPLYKQCDSKWGNNTMGVPGMTKEDDTICHQGCAMSSVSMALAGMKVLINGEIANPGSLNSWLRDNQGYHCLSGDCCNLVLDAPARIDPTRVKCLGEPIVPFFSTLRKLVDDGLIVIAHVRNQHHFVLITGIVEGKETFYVNDPGFDVKTYDYSDIHDVILYDILPPQEVL